MPTVPESDVLRRLIERVRLAEGPNYALECEIGRRLLGINPYHAQPPNCTASLDAALALMARVLPGAMWAVGSMEAGPFCRLVYPRPNGWGLAESLKHEGGAQTEPLAIVLATLTARLAMLEAAASADSARPTHEDTAGDPGHGIGTSEGRADGQ